MENCIGEELVEDLEMRQNNQGCGDSSAEDKVGRAHNEKGNDVDRKMAELQWMRETEW